MAGVYIHIPFCTQKCHYCNFFSQPAIQLIPQYIDSICREIELQKSYLSEPVKTIYFGGGTPGLLSPQQIEQILNVIHKNYDIAVTEITLEVNPDDINPEYLHKIKEIGINRLSMGVQSLDDRDLKWLNRRHSAEQAINAVLEAKKAGFDNISIDLIYGIPVQSQKRWSKQLEKALEIRPQHLSAYALTVESGTALHHFISHGERQNVDDEHALSCFKILKSATEKHGYHQYEVSNFAIIGKESQHNSSYWNQTPYLGIGASAHSYNKNSRQWNICAINKYMQSINEGITPFEYEILSREDKINEYVMTSLRTAKGCNLKYIKEAFGRETAKRIADSSAQFINKGLLIHEDDYLSVGINGWFQLDGIAASLFIE